MVFKTEVDILRLPLANSEGEGGRRRGAAVNGSAVPTWYVIVMPQITGDAVQ